MYGQIVIGPPGSGKTTYTAGMQQFMEGLKRDVVVVNLDPANDSLPYKCHVDISQLVSVTDVMENLKLGPNGALMFCMEYLEQNLDWLQEKLASYKSKYIIFDCPGQVELYTHHKSAKNIVSQLQHWGYRLTCVHLVDSHYCTDAGKFIAVLLTSLSSMLQLELPHINVLSKADLIEKFGKLAFSLDYYTEVLDLKFLLDHLGDDAVFQKYQKLNEALINVIEDYSLVSFQLLNIQDKKSVTRILASVDKANGYIYGGVTESADIQSLFSCAVGAELQYDKISDIREKYTDTATKIDDL